MQQPITDDQLTGFIHKLQSLSAGRLFRQILRPKLIRERRDEERERERRRMRPMHKYAQIFMLINCPHRLPRSRLDGFRWVVVGMATHTDGDDAESRLFMFCAFVQFLRNNKTSKHVVWVFRRPRRRRRRRRCVIM